MQGARPRSLLTLALVLLTTVAHADDEPRVTDATPAAAASGDLHAQLTAQVTAEAASIDRALATVTEKLAAADHARTERARAAARLLGVALPADAAPADRLAAARRAAAARLLLARDVDERGLLATEADRLRAAGQRVAADAAKVDSIQAPANLAWPVRGTVARAFGAFEHERSHAQLSRRGVDLEVEDHAPVTAPADGVVRYAGPIRGLEHGLVIESAGYLVVLGKLADASLPVGAEVHRGDRVGRAARHRVYLEIRVALGAGGLPIDPESVLDKREHERDPKRRAR